MDYTGESYARTTQIKNLKKGGLYMARAGQNYTITLRQAHLEWGTHRYTNSRGVVYGEGYIPIPDQEARMLNIQNQNGTGYTDVFLIKL